ncbi:MAG: LysM peptidoglycan-binding domain-containing protein [Chloroflexota bacterium]
MNRLATHRKWLILGVVFSLLSATFSAYAQGQNLLTNPGFEGSFTSYTDATPARQVAQGWVPWYIGGGQSASENVYPEYYPASDVSDGLGKPRIRSGNEAQQYFSFFATHDGGIYQRVTGITVGSQLTFSAYAYVWSSSFDDLDKSEDPGGVVVQVGIDPTGGTDGSSASIVWSSPAVQYDAYNQYSVTTSASGTAVTVFVRSTVSTPIKSNNIYIDDASLTAGGGSQPPTATNPPIPTLPPPTTQIPTQAPVATNTPGDIGIVTSTPQPTQGPVVSTDTPQPLNTVEPATATPTQEVLPATETPGPTPTPTISIGGTPISNDFPGTVYHTVQAGDTVGKLAELYGSSIDAIIAVNGLNQSAFIKVGQGLAIPVRLAAPATSTPTITPIVPVVPTFPPDGSGSSSNTAYIVQRGDTLYRISVRFNTTITTLAQLNGITNVNLIYAGQRLLIAPPGSGVPVPTPVPTTQRTYMVVPGDTLFRIALRYGVPLRQIAQANGIFDPNRIFVGQVLSIP